MIDQLILFGNTNKEREENMTYIQKSFFSPKVFQIRNLQLKIIKYK